jgi:hypothetical protein
MGFQIGKRGAYFDAVGAATSDWFSYDREGLVAYGWVRKKEFEGKRRVGTYWFYGLVDTVYGRWWKS